MTKVPAHEHAALGRLEWEPECNAWVVQYRVTIEGRDEPIELRVWGEGRDAMSLGQARLADRVVHGLLAERWPLRSGSTATPHEWGLHAQRARTVVTVIDDRRFRVELHAFERSVRPAEGRILAAWTYDDDDSAGFAGRPLRVELDDAVRTALQQTVDAGDELQLERGLDALHAALSGRPSFSRRTSDDHLELLDRWESSGLFALAQGQDRAAFARKLQAFLRTLRGSHVPGPALGRWLVKADEVDEVFASDEELDRAIVAEHARASMAARGEPLAPLRPVDELTKSLDEPALDALERAVEAAAKGDEQARDRALEDLEIALRERVSG